MNGIRTKSNSFRGHGYSSFRIHFIALQYIALYYIILHCIWKRNRPRQDQHIHIVLNFSMRNSVGVPNKFGHFRESMHHRNHYKFHHHHDYHRPPANDRYMKTSFNLFVEVSLSISRTESSACFGLESVIQQIRRNHTGKKKGEFICSRPTGWATCTTIDASMSGLGCENFATVQQLPDVKWEFVKMDQLLSDIKLVSVFWNVLRCFEMFLTVFWTCFWCFRNVLRNMTTNRQSKRYRSSVNFVF